MVSDVGPEVGIEHTEALSDCTSMVTYVVVSIEIVRWLKRFGTGISSVRSEVS
jgi:hypothetical protein